MRDEFRRHLGKSVLVQLDVDQAVAGVLMRVTPVTLVLADATMVLAAPTPIDGEIVLTRTFVTWMQVA